MKRIVIAIVFLTLMISFHGQLFAKEGNSIETALKAYNRGNFQRAVDLLKEQVKQRPDARAYYLIGYGLYSLGRYNEASEFFSQAYLIDPDFTPDKHNLPRIPEKTVGLSAKTPEPAKKVAEKQKEPAKKAVPEEVKREVKKEVKTGPPPSEAEVKEATKPRASEERKQPEQKQAVQPPAVTPRQAPEKAFKPASPFPQGKQQTGRPPSGLGILLLTGFYTTFFIIGVLVSVFCPLPFPYSKKTLRSRPMDSLDPPCSDLDICGVCRETLVVDTASSHTFCQLYNRDISLDVHLGKPRKEQMARVTDDRACC